MLPLGESRLAPDWFTIRGVKKHIKQPEEKYDWE